jgi:cytochrome c oxidase subunit II
VRRRGQSLTFAVSTYASRRLGGGWLTDRPIDPCQITQVCATSRVPGAASSLLIHRTVRASRSLFLFAIAVAGTALLSGPTSTLLARQDLATASAPIVVEVTAKRFAFEPEQIEVTEGDHVRLVVSSADGVHGIGIKKFKVEKKIPRGETVTIDFVASTAGTFPVLCSEYCGKGHEDMKGTLVVKVRP